MGNSMNKDKSEEAVDGGQLVPHGMYKGSQDWDYRGVRKLIIERKLAPFYKGLADHDESWDEVTLTTHNLPKNGKGSTIIEECQPIKRATTSNTVGSTKGKEVSTKSLETQLYKGAVECPICFLYYPRNINHSRCCDQPICTECFVQIKRPESGTLGANNSPAVCPFCVEPNFGVCYKPPSFSTGIGSESMPTPNSGISLLPTSSSSSSLSVSDGKARRKSVSHKNPDVVTTDQIRPDWAMRTLQPARQSPGARRPSTTTSTSRRVLVRPSGGNNYVSSNTPPARRNNPSTIGAPPPAEYGGYWAMRMGTDLEELMVMEAIRLSLMEQDERGRREAEQRESSDRSQDENPDIIFSSEDSTSGTITISHLSSNEGGIENVSLDGNLQENDCRNSNGDGTQSEIDSHLSRDVQIYHLIDENEEDYEISSTSHSHNNISTTPIITSTESGTITSASAPSSSTGSSSPSTKDSTTTNSTTDSTTNLTINLTTNKTNDVLVDPSPPLSFSRNNILTVAETTEVSEGSSEQENPPSFDITHRDDVLLSSDEQDQTSENANDIKKQPVIILPNTSLVEEVIERDGDTRDARSGQ
ncbi:4895_t:CDS:2 [Diversispora eburnea]|uniref:4895_t:CDS:1 n=1 Tax=Diversispora eburnea TaxID=1213867 RepID=A0A9N9BXC6_9GLOM|nr:4895_t:CDS:2 [Diversispora eburnea]